MRLFLYISLLFLGFACTPVKQGNRPLVVTTTTMITDLAQQIAGEELQLVGLMGPGVDPHLFKANHFHLRALYEADLVLYNGLLLEGKLAEILEKMPEKAVPLSRGVPDSLLMRPPEFEGAYDPHLWFDVQLWQLVLNELVSSLQQLAPEHADIFQIRAQNYSAKLDSLDQWVLNSIHSIPENRRVMITAHDAFGYFGRRYGIQVLGLQGISTLAEFGLRDLSSLADFILKNQIPAVFVESSVPARSIEALVQGVRSRGGLLKIGGELYSDAMGDLGRPEGTYIGMVRHNVSTIVKALKAE